MNAYTIKHRRENFQTELTQLEKEDQKYTFNENESEVRRNRKSFLSTQIEGLTSQLSELNWTKVTK